MKIRKVKKHRPLRITKKGLLVFSKRTLVSYLITSTIIIGGGLLYLFNPWSVGKTEAAWFNDSWGYRKEIPVTAHTAAENNVFVSFTLDTATLITASKLQSACQDIRITDVSGKLLQYHVGRTNPCNNAATTIDFLVPTFGAGASTFYVYYGNGTAVSADIGSNFTQSEAAGYTIGGLGTEAKGTAPVLSYKFDEGQGNTAYNGSTIAKNSTSGTSSIAYVQSKSSQSAAADGTESVTFTSTPSSGNLIIVACALSNGNFPVTPVTDNKGNTYTQINTQITNNVGPNKIGLFYAKNITASATFTVTCTSSAGTDVPTIAAHEYSGADTVNPLDQNNVSGATGSSITSGSITTATNNELYFAAMTHDSTSPTITPTGSGYTQREEFETSATTMPINTVDKVAAAGTVNETWTTSFSVGYATTIASFKPGSGTTVATNGTLNSSPTWKSEDMCVSGKCLYFDGATNQSVSTADNASLDFAAADNFTLEGWVKRNGASSANNVIISKASGNLGTTYQGYKLFMSAAGLLCFNTRDGTNAEDTTCSSTRFDDDKWHHVAGVKVGTTSLTLYVDGKANGTPDASIASTGSLVNSGTFYVGVDSDGTSTEWLGFLDEMKVYPSAKSADQIAADYTARGGGKGAAESIGATVTTALANGLVGYWKMDDGSGNTTDASGNGLTLTNNNTVAYASGKFGYAGSFTAASLRYFSTATTISGVKTVSFWTFNASNTDEYINLISGTAYITSSSGVVSATGFTSPTIYVNGVVNGTITASAWNHVVIVTTTAINASAFEIGRGNGAYNNGLIDDVRVYNRSLSGGEVTQLYNFAPGSVGKWDFEEGSGTSAFDSSGYGNTGTITAGSGGYTNGKYGKAYTFDGTITSINAGSATSVDNLPATGMTIDAWVYPKSAGEGNAGVIIAKNVGTTPSAGWLLQLSSTRQLTFSVDGATDLVRTSTNTLTQNAWSHVSVTWDGVITTATSVHMYINGSEGAYSTSTNGATRVDDASSTVFIGNDSSSARTFDGYIDQVRLYNYPQTQKQVTQELNGGHPAPGSPVGSPALYLKFEEGVQNRCSGGSNDACNSGSAGNAIDAAFNGGVNFTSSGKFGKGLFLDGTNDYLTLPDNDALELTDDFTISMWMYLTSAPASSLGGTIFAKDDGAGNFAPLGVELDNTMQLRVWASTTCTSWDVLDSNTTPQLGDLTSALTFNVWHHFVLRRSGSTWQVFIDGYKRGTTATAPGTLCTNARTVNLFGGFQSPSSGNGLRGKVDEYKIFKSALTDDQIRLDMNRGQSQVFGALSDTSNVTGGSIASQSASAEYCIPGDSTACTAPVGRWDFEEGSGTTATDVSGNNPGVFTGSATYTTGRTGKGLSITGSSDFVSVANTLSTKTVAFWVKPTSNTANLIDLRTAATVTNISVSAGTVSATGFTTPSIYVNGMLNGTLTANVWNYVVVTSGTAVSANAIKFGRINATTDLRGTIDAVRFFDYARSAAQVAWDYNRGTPVAWYKFDECQGTTINDSTGNLLTGTWTGTGAGTTAIGTCQTAATDWGNGVSGKRNYSLDFDGSDDVVTVTNTPKIDIDSNLANFTIAAWINADTAGESSVGQIFNKTTNNYLRTTTGLGLEANFDRATTDANIAISSALTAGAWTHVVETWDGTTLKLYINGFLRGSANGSGAVTADTGDLLIGGVTTANFDGRIDDFRVYNYAATATQVKGIVNDGAIRFGPVTGTP